MSFELEIKKLRNKKDWTQKTLASMVGVVEATVSRWERGLHPPSDPEALLNRLAEYVSESDLAPLRAEIEKEKGPEKHQQAEESPNPSQGTDSVAKAADLFTTARRYARLHLKNDHLSKTPLSGRGLLFG